MANSYVEDDFIRSSIVHYLSATGTPDIGAAPVIGEYRADWLTAPWGFLQQQDCRGVEDHCYRTGDVWPAGYYFL